MPVDAPLVMSDAFDWPFWGWSDDVRPGLAAEAAAGRSCALATLVRTEGPAPRAAGTQMLVTKSAMSGFLSGGCIEADVAVHARAAIRDGAPRRLLYGEGSPWRDIRLQCGGSLEILVERLDPGAVAVADLLRLARERRPATWATDGRVRGATPAGPDTPAFSLDPEAFAFARRHDPPWRLVVMGGDPAALAIAALGAQGGLETTLVRPSGPSEAPPLPGVAYRRSEPEEGLREIGVDPWTAVAVITHDLDADEAALAAALRRGAGYVGVMGARARLPERLARLRALEVPEEALAGLRAPIGLPIGGKSPWHVAVAVIAEVLEVIHVRAERPT